MAATNNKEARDRSRSQSMAAPSDKAGRARSRSPGQRIKVFVHDLSGSLLCEVNAARNEYVFHLCEAIEDLEGTEEALQQLVFKGKRMNSSEPLKTYKVPQNAHITLIRLPKPLPFTGAIPVLCKWCFQRRYCTDIEVEKHFWGEIEVERRTQIIYICKECWEDDVHYSRIRWPH